MQTNFPDLGPAKLRQPDKLLAPHTAEKQGGNNFSEGGKKILYNWGQRWGARAEYYAPQSTYTTQSRLRTTKEGVMAGIPQYTT